MRVRNKKWLLGLTLLPSFVFAQSMPRTNGDTAKIITHQFSIQQAVEYAKKNNVNVKSAFLDVQMQEQANKR